MKFEYDDATDGGFPEFDVQWYLSQYPDVKMLGMDPLQHFKWIGKKLGRSGSPAGLQASQHSSFSAESEVIDTARDPWAYFNRPAPIVSPDDEVLVTRLMHYVWSSRPDLQQHFDVTSPQGRVGLHNWFMGSFERDYGVSLTPPRKPSPFDLDTAGANLIGYAKGELGMGEHVRMVATALDAVSTPFDVVNVAADGHGESDTSISHWISGRQGFATNIFHINADMLPIESLKFGRGYYNVGYWAWELPTCPSRFDTALDIVDEVWACSEFTAQAFRTRAKVPVISMPLAVEVPKLSKSKYTKAYYGLPADKFAFFFTFDAMSMLDRKNPIAVVKAFNRAFPEGDEPVQLVFKAMNTDHGGELWEKLLAEIDSSSRITVIDRRFSKEDTLGLNLACDAFVSLHRAEGFGRCIAEAMSYGKPVIATNYSGSCEFVREKTACAIDYELIPVPEESYPNSEGALWADPNIGDAAAAMLKLVEDEDFRTAKAKAGQKFIRDHFNSKVIGQKYRDRLGSIQQVGVAGAGRPTPTEDYRGKARKYAKGKRTSLFTITSKNYVSYARTVLNSVAKLHPEYALFLCLADEPGDGFDMEGERFMIVPSSALDIPCFLDMTVRYDVLEFNTAVKPFMFQWVYDSTEVENVIYFDPDLHLYQRLDDLTEELDKGATAVLTPHLCEPLVRDGFLPDDQSMLQAGVFNLGFIATRRSEESRRFIDWWGEKLRTGARVDLAKGLFTDQKWCDLAPCFMPNLKVLHDPGYNAAYWNLAQRELTLSEDGSCLVNGRPLVFFHFSGINPTKIEQVSKHQNRFKWEDLNEVCQRLFADYAKTLLANDWEGSLKFPYAYDKIEGFEVPGIMRSTFAAFNPLPRNFSSAREVRQYLLEICNRPAQGLQIEKHNLSELMVQIYRLRPDLQEAFSLRSKEGRVGFKKWFAESARHEYRLTPAIFGIG
jgi:glycosyltransferase involved in cell wall biosynthesis